MVLFAREDGGFWRAEEPAVSRWFHRGEDPEAVLRDLQARQGSGVLVVALQYEAGADFAGELASGAQTGQRVGWGGVFETWDPVSREDLEREFPGPAYLTQGRPVWDLERYLEAYEGVRRALAQGDTYQLNLTFPIEADLVEPQDVRAQARQLFLKLSQGGQGTQGAYVELPEEILLSVSPEVFFHKTGDQVVCRPMKGTAARDGDPQTDGQRARDLAQSEKNRAENLMITDMIRNDLGRVARPGTVQVPQLFQVETYPTVHQMTSTVTAEASAGLAELLGALFPCASITGAPKRRSMELLQGLEGGPRGWYTGTLGWVRGAEMRFNVAIRTLVLDRATGKGRLGVGGGVVWDSEGPGEYQEALLKSRFLQAGQRDFDLTEALKWTPEEGYWLLERHLDRLEWSWQAFGETWSRSEVRRALEAAGPWAEAQKVRLSLGPRGELRVEAQDLGSTPSPMVLALAPEPLAPETGLWRRFKTSRREVYDRVKIPGVHQVIFYNREGHLTETTSMNLVVKMEDRWWTPPLADGLLAGTYREELLVQGKIFERTLTREDLEVCQEVAVINSVRGWVPGVLKKGGPLI